MAKARALTCKGSHDTCLKTTKYRNAGQNICSYSGRIIDDAVYEMCMKAWFNEVKDTGPLDIAKYKST